MNKFSFELSKSTEKFLNKSDKATRERIFNIIYGIVENPYSYNGTIKLTGYDNLYRVRVGKYRIIYRIIDNELLIFIQDIDSRGQIYKRL